MLARIWRWLMTDSSVNEYEQYCQARRDAPKYKCLNMAAHKIKR